MVLCARCAHTLYPLVYVHIHKCGVGNQRKIMIIESNNTKHYAIAAVSEYNANRRRSAFYVQRFFRSFAHMNERFVFTFRFGRTLRGRIFMSPLWMFGCLDVWLQSQIYGKRTETQSKLSELFVIMLFACARSLNRTYERNIRSNNPMISTNEYF